VEAGPERQHLPEDLPTLQTIEGLADRSFVTADDRW